MAARRKGKENNLVSEDESEGLVNHYPSDEEGKLMADVLDVGGDSNDVMSDVPLASGTFGGDSQQNATSTDSSTVPVGYWKDRFWDICAPGCLHPSVWFSCFCTLLAAGQLIGRLQLSMCGNPNNSGKPNESKIIFNKFLYIWISYWLLRLVIFSIIFILDPNKEDAIEEYVHPSGHYFFFAALDDIISWSFWIWIAFLLRNIRRHIRTKYSIPETNTCTIKGYEDSCCSLFCPCFTSAQMMRHTADYHIYPGLCCTSTGLPATAPSIV